MIQKYTFQIFFQDWVILILEKIKIKCSLSKENIADGYFRNLFICSHYNTVLINEYISSKNYKRVHYQAIKSEYQKVIAHAISKVSAVKKLTVPLHIFCFFLLKKMFILPIKSLFCQSLEFRML